MKRSKGPPNIGIERILRSKLFLGFLDPFDQNETHNPLNEHKIEYMNETCWMMNTEHSLKIVRAKKEALPVFNFYQNFVACWIY